MSDLLRARALETAWKRELSAHESWIASGAPPPEALLAPAMRQGPAVEALPSESLQPQPSSACFERLEAYARLVLAANERMNLVSRRDPEQQILVNILDSIPFIGVWADVSRETGPEDEAPRFLIDAGSGSGVPGLPLQLLLADRDIPPPDLLLVESRGHKADFLEQTLDALALDRAAVWGGRLEDPSLPGWLEDEGWTGPGCLLSRALASVSTTLDWCRPLQAEEWLSDAFILKGVPGFLKEWNEEGRRWTRGGWAFPRMQLFIGAERPLCFLQGSWR